MPLSTADNPIELETPTLIATYKKNKTVFLVVGLVIVLAAIYYFTRKPSIK